MTIRDCVRSFSNGDLTRANFDRTLEVVAGLRALAAEAEEGAEVVAELEARPEES